MSRRSLRKNIRRNLNIQTRVRSVSRINISGRTPSRHPEQIRANRVNRVDIHGKAPDNKYME